MATQQKDVIVGPVAVNGFPARRLTKSNSYEGGQWVIAYQAEQRTHLKVVFMDEDQQQRRNWTNLSPPTNTREASGVAKQILDREFLMKHCFVRRPTDLSHADISGTTHKSHKAEDFKDFDSLVHMNASESALPMETFKEFPVLEHLELCVCGISDIAVTKSDFAKLLYLDLSYNSVSSQSLLALGTLPQLRELHLTGNDIVALPVELSRPFKTNRELSNTKAKDTGSMLEVRFAVLESLWLDNNKLCDQTTFSTLAGLRRLKYLNLDNNELYSVPQLRLIGTSHLVLEDKSASHPQKVMSKSQRSPSSSSSSSRRRRTRSDERSQRSTLNLSEVGKIKKEMADMAEEKESERDSIEVAETERPVSVSQLPPSMAPFPHLITLSLANNLFFSSEGLQFCGLWPALKELILYGNPVIGKYNGMPPRLQTELCQKRNIHVVRHKPKTKRFHIAQGAKDFKKIPTCELETQLSLPPLASNPLPLPPSESTPFSPASLPNTTTNDEENDSKDSIFITQGMSEEGNVQKQSDYSESDCSRIEATGQNDTMDQRLSRVSTTGELPQQYRGYEALFEEDPRFPLPPIPTDLHGCINALRHTLKHGTLYKQQQHHNSHRMVKDRQDVAATNRTPRDTHRKVRDMHTALDEIRTSAATLQTNLASLLDMDVNKDQPTMELQKEGKLLLKQLQAKYADAQRENENQAK